jgi:hypothetical protein
MGAITRSGVVMQRSHVNHSFRPIDITLGASNETPSERRFQQLSELRERHVIRDKASTAAGEALLRRLANDVPRFYRLDVAPTAALLARCLDGDR